MKYCKAVIDILNKFNYIYRASKIVIREDEQKNRFFKERYG